MKQQYASILVDVWREVCRHQRLQDSISRIACLIADLLPINALVLRSIDCGCSRVSTTAVWKQGTEREFMYTDRECPGTDPETLIAWCHEGRSRRVGEQELRQLPHGIVPSGLTGNLLFTPLGEPEAPSGILILRAWSPYRFDEKDVALTSSLAGPLTVALENHARTEELVLLR